MVKLSIQILEQHLSNFSALAKRDKQLAKETLEKYRNFYHSIVVKYIELDMKAI